MCVLLFVCLDFLTILFWGERTRGLRGQRIVEDFQNCFEVSRVFLILFFWGGGAGEPEVWSVGA